jgi:hypothetical protein
MATTAATEDHLSIVSSDRSLRAQISNEPKLGR